MRLFALYLLALLDGILCGLRTAMGRYPFIRKGGYYFRATIRGLVGAQFVSAVALVALLVVVLFSPNRERLRVDLEAAAGRMLTVFLPYAALVLGSLMLRIAPSTDVRSATSVFLLGPLTAVRPGIMVAGVAYGVLDSRRLETWFLGLVVLGLMLSLELFLNRWMARKQVKAIAKLLPAPELRLERGKS